MNFCEVFFLGFLWEMRIWCDLHVYSSRAKTGDKWCNQIAPHQLQLDLQGWAFQQANVVYQQAKCKTLVKEVEQNLINCQPVIVLEYLANPFRPCWDLAKDGRTAHAIEDALAFDSRLEASKVPRSSARGSFPHLGGRFGGSWSCWGWGKGVNAVDQLPQTAQAVYLHRVMLRCFFHPREIKWIKYLNSVQNRLRSNEILTFTTAIKREVIHSPQPPGPVHQRTCKSQKYCLLTFKWICSQPASCVMYHPTYTLYIPIPSAHPSTASRHLWRLAPSASGNPPLLLASGTLKWNRPNRMHVEVSGSPGML